MNIFDLQRNIMDDYRAYIRSFIHIADEAIDRAVKKELEAGKLWPEPLIQFNPTFKPGVSMTELTQPQGLHPDLNATFHGYRLYAHQVEAIRLGMQGRDFIVTSGTGSGKSLTYLATIFNHLLAEGKEKRPPGIKAILVYPMNALINSQAKEIEDYATRYHAQTGREFPITFAQYTGQENQETKARVQKEKPDIILTNYMMLELILTRYQEKLMRHSIFEHLEYLVFDELHTYRGRQGSDVAMLIRRIKAQARHEVLCIGTSATMVAGDGSIHSQKAQVAQVGEKLFGAHFAVDQIVMEQLTPSFDVNSSIPAPDAVRTAIQAGIDPAAGQTALRTHPLAIWLENAIALETKQDGDQPILVRRKPQTKAQIVEALQKHTRLEEEACATALEDLLLWIQHVNAQLRERGERYSLLPYKLHQFISQTGSVYMTLDQDESRYITLEPGPFVKVQQQDALKRKYPVVFSRQSGAAYYCVALDEAAQRIMARDFDQLPDKDSVVRGGYLIATDQPEEVWNPAEDLEEMPDTWVRVTKAGVRKPESRYRDRMPVLLHFDGEGNYDLKPRANLPYQGWFMQAPLLFDPTSGTFFDHQMRERTKLTPLGSEGRSTSTTINSFAILRRMAAEYEEKQQKVMSFTDNRQDAALQAGHFNDFISVLRLRSAVYHALKAQPGQELAYTSLGQAMFDALQLPFDAYSRNPIDPRFAQAAEEVQTHLKAYLTYRALHDLRRSWRIVLPNLEQCALLEIDYKHLRDTAAQHDLWQGLPLLEQLTADERYEVLRQVFDYFRKSYALASEVYLNPQTLVEQANVIKDALKAPWTFDQDEDIPAPTFMRVESMPKQRRRYGGIETQSAGSRSALGKFFKLTCKQHQIDPPPPMDEFLTQLLELLASGGWLERSETEGKGGKPIALYRLKLSTIRWKLGDGENVVPDQVKVRTYKLDRAHRPPPNRFFQQLYQLKFHKMKTLQGGEHTGQLGYKDRQAREDLFREGKMSALFCSPTMELGIDIASLNIVHLRNAPPNPANYAQRSGRAGRSGQAALVFTYCSAYSPHDRHYFQDRVNLVAGAVAPPRLDLANEELLRTHLHALILARTNLDELNQSLIDLTDQTQQATLPLLPKVERQLQLDPVQRQQVHDQFLQVLGALQDELREERHAWFTSDWVSRQIELAPQRLDEALKRWRELYFAAQRQIHRAGAIIQSPVRTQDNQKLRQAQRDQRQGIQQRELLVNDRNTTFSEFYPFRYLAAEAFLPGYNFTRLPLRTYVATDRSGGGEFISRPRFIALREFGPRNIIYHNGAKYRINRFSTLNLEDQLQQNARVSLSSGYFLNGSNQAMGWDPFGEKALASHDDYKDYGSLLQMAETQGQSQERITCEEEERTREGYDIKTYFRVPEGMRERMVDTIIKSGKDELMRLRYIPTAELIQLNEKWRRTKVDGFVINKETGFWKKFETLDQQEDNEEPVALVQLYTQDTADALYLEPLSALQLDQRGVLTLMYALKRGIEQVFQVEPREIGASLMGENDPPNLFIYEAAEGSLGVLSQFPDRKDLFREVVKAAYDLCRYDDETYQEPASYDDLLSYFNQRDHEQIDRGLIKEALEVLQRCEMEIRTSQQDGDYESHYQRIKAMMDPDSSTEEKFLTYLYQHGLRLPDEAQPSIPEVYVRPDFYYEPRICVFCDGSPHDQAQVQERDQAQRDALWDAGYQVLAWHYQDDLAAWLQQRPDVFKSVK